MYALSGSITVFETVHTPHSVQRRYWFVQLPWRSEIVQLDVRDRFSRGSWVGHTTFSWEERPRLDPYSNELEFHHKS